MNFFSLSYDFHTPKKPEDYDKIREYIVYLLVKENSNPIKRFTESTISFGSSKPQKYFEELFSDLLGHQISYTLSEIKPNFDTVNIDEDLESNFDKDIERIRNLSPTTINEDLGGFIAYFLA
jgi:hypothetical protein